MYNYFLSNYLIYILYYILFYGLIIGHGRPLFITGDILLKNIHNIHLYVKNKKYDKYKGYTFINNNNHDNNIEKQR